MLRSKGVIQLKQILDKRGMTEDDWQAYRQTQKGIGGSDVATILGLNPYKTAFTLWLEKTGQVKPAPIDNEYVEWGNILEPVIRDKFARETGFQVKENPYVLQHDDHDFMIANIDGEVFDFEKDEWGVLEIKTASERMKGEWEEGPPHHYMLQIQHYLAVMDYNYAYVACLLGGNHFKYFVTTVTSAPNALASCTAKEPTPPEPPLISTFCVGRISPWCRRP